MNSPTDPRPDHADLSERVTRLEVICDRILDELREMRVDMRDMRREISLARTVDFRILFGSVIAVATALAGLMAHGFGWI